MQGSWCAGKGAGQAMKASVASQLPTLRSLASWLPEIILGSTVFKSLQVGDFQWNSASVTAAAMWG